MKLGEIAKVMRSRSSEGRLLGGRQNGASSSPASSSADGPVTLGSGAGWQLWPTICLAIALGSVAPRGWLGQVPVELLHPLLGRVSTSRHRLTRATPFSYSATEASSPTCPPSIRSIIDSTWASISSKDSSDSSDLACSCSHREGTRASGQRPDGALRCRGSRLGPRGWIVSISSVAQDPNRSGVGSISARRGLRTNWRTTWRAIWPSTRK